MPCRLLIAQAALIRAMMEPDNSAKPLPRTFSSASEELRLDAGKLVTCSDKRARLAKAPLKT